MPANPAETDLHDGRQAYATLDQIKPNHVQRYKWVIEQLKRFDYPIRVVDAACGAGYGSGMIADAGFPVTGIEINMSALEFARQYHKRPGNFFMYGDLNTLTPPKCDVIVSLETIEHIEDATDLSRRFADSASFLIGSVPNEDVVPFNNHPHHFRHYTKDEIESILTEAGWRVTTWAAQINKFPGTIVDDSTDGMGLLFLAEKR